MTVDAARQRDGQRQRGLELHHGGLAERRPQPDGHRHRCGRQYRRGLERAERHHRHDRPGCPDHHLVLDRQRRRGDGITNDNTLTLTGTAEANARSRSMTAPRCSAARLPRQRRLELYHGGAGQRRPQPDATATDAAGNTSAASTALSVTIDTTRRSPRPSPRSRPTAAWSVTASPMTIP